MNVKLLRKVQDAILLNPWAFDMHDWISKSEVSPCGTAACIFGWAATIDAKEKEPSWRMAEIAMRAESLLGLGPYWPLDDNDNQNTPARRLAICDAWPAQFSSAYYAARSADNHEAAALIAAARIEHFIQTEGRE